VSDGILLVDKPAGPTSADVVRAIKRRFREPSIGHLGTLDPMATGLLPLCLGAGTKIAQFLAAEHKAYEGEIRLGIATDTLDVTGRVTAEAPVPVLDAVILDRAASGLVGRSEQRPPMYSAVKVGGRELYKLARQGIEVEREARPVEIHSLRLAPVPGDPTLVRFAVDCSKGTYVRVLAEDVGRALGTVAALASLRRTAFGAFSVDRAHPLDALLALPEGAPLPVLGIREALRPLRELAVDRPLAHAIANGQVAALQRLAPPRPEEGLAAVIAPGGEVLAVVAAAGSSWTLKRVVQPGASQLYRP
jgi:tRNA pseudouridine55 synthase